MPRSGLSQDADKNYKPYLNRCMNLVRGTDHPKTYEYSDEELYTLRPEEIARFFGIIAYGNEHPNLQTDNPTNGRSSTLEYAKKSISYYMPNRNMVWNNRSKEGNPTKSDVLNDFIKVVKKKEVRKEGKTSQAKRPMDITEYRQLIGKIRNGDLSKKYALAAYFIFQFHMIARVDDVMHFSQEDLTPNLEYDYTFKSKMKWSKNILDESRTSDQIVIGAADPKFCAILALAVHLEVAIGNGDLEKDGVLMGISKTVATNALKAVIDADDFNRAPLAGLLGSHSNRKFASTHARRNGCSRDDVDLRGRWKGNKKIVDLYIDNVLPYPDGKVAGSLCVGGPIKYELKQGSRITENFLLTHVAPHIASFFPKAMVITFAKALLWGIFDDNFSEHLPNAMVGNVRSAARQLMDEGESNPVKKVPIIVSGEEATLVLTEVNVDDDEDGGGSGGASSIVGSDAGTAAQIQLLLSTVRTLTRQNDELKTELQVFKNTCNTLLEQVNSNLRRIAMIPGARQARGHDRSGGNENGGDATRGTIPFTLTLVKNPKSLHVLWQEYEFGVGGRKPAREFSSKERGAVKFSYSLRKYFWELVDKMINKGYTHASAIDRIYLLYGTKTCTTKVLQNIRRDSKVGHPLLN